MKRTIIWILALIAGALLGLLNCGWLNEVLNFIATIYTRLFQLLAVPTIMIAVITTLTTFSSKANGYIFGRTITYTLLTTLAAAFVGATLYVAIAPGNLPAETISINSQTPDIPPQTSYIDHIISIVPNNIIRPIAEGNVLSLLLLAFAIGFGLSKMPDTENKSIIVKGFQDLLFILIRWHVWTLPIGIVAFSAQLSAQLSAGIIADSIGKYVLVVLSGNVIQFFIVLPLFLLAKGLNPKRIFTGMAPAILTALFTKSSAATLPVTISSAEQRLGIHPNVSRFVLPICTTINMNGCAAFILVTSLFVMQQGGTPITFGIIAQWILISVISAIGNAGVPMGCYFLTLSLLSGTGAPIAILGIILPIYTIIDMVETAENVWSDSCVATIVDHEVRD